MSAYVVDHCVINRIVSTAIALRVWTPGHNQPRAPINEANATEVGHTLLAECIKSVEYRYPSLCARERAGYAANLADYRFETALPGTRAFAANALCELDYQSCEHPGWAKSDAHAILRAIAFRLLTDAARVSTPGPLNPLHRPLTGW